MGWCLPQIGLRFCWNSMFGVFLFVHEAYKMHESDCEMELARYFL